MISYIRKRTDHNLFRDVPWVEEDLVATIRNEYDFELSPDTTATWRIGDGTAAFYNYIYRTITGLTETILLDPTKFVKGPSIATTLLLSMLLK